MNKSAKFSTYIMCVLLTLTLTFTAFAAESTVTYKGRKSGFEFAPGSVYTSTDMFDNFKNVMPGDVKAEKITITNKSTYSDYIAVYMGALLHDAEDNPISPKVLEELAEDERRGTMSELDYMHDFLEQLTLTVWDGEKKDENIIYKGTPDSLEDGLEDGNVFIGSLGYGQSLELNVELAVDIEMGNEYADRIGEVDWVFVIEERFEPNDPDDPKKPTKGPGSGGGSNEPDGTSDGSDGPHVSVEDEEGFFMNVLPMTGDNTVIWPFVVLLAAALIGIVVLMKGKRKDKDE